MEDQLEQILKEKILAAVDLPVSGLTRRDAGLPNVSNKAMAVIGMRMAEGRVAPEDGSSEMEDREGGGLLGAGRNIEANKI